MNNIITKLDQKRVMPGAWPLIYKKSADTACLLLHGFTASPQAYLGLSDKLRKEGISHYAPLLLGHGTDVRDLNQINWPQQQDFVEKIFNKLSRQHKKIFLIGESSGGALALRLAAKYADQVSGVVTVCGAVKYPSERFLKTVVPFYRLIYPYPKKVRGADVKDRLAIKERVAYDKVPLKAFERLMRYSDKVIKDLPKVKAPLLILQTLHDHAVAPESADIVYALSGSARKKVVWYPESYHILLVDLEKEKAFKDILHFIKRERDIQV